MIARLLSRATKAAIAATVLAHASTALAWTTNVNTTETSFGPPNGNCSIYDAISLFSGGDPDACFWQLDGQEFVYTIKLIPGTYLIQEGVQVSGFTLAGSSVGNTTLRTNGFPNPTAVVMDNGTLQDLTVRGQNLVGPTLGIYSGVNSSTLNRVRVTGFNNSGIQNGFYDDKGTPTNFADDDITAGSLTILSSTIDHNTSPGGGGGILNCGDLEIRKSTINNNTGAHGGGIDQRYGQIFTYYSTIASNRANAGRGGGVHAQPAPDFNGNFAEFNAYHVTIAFNSASQASGGGGVFVESSTTWVSNKVNASVIAKNTSGNNNAQDDYRGRLRSDNLGFQDGLNANLLGTSGTRPGFQNGFDIVNANPGLAAALANNGGPTQTIALNSGSPAVNASQNPVTPPGTPPRNYDTGSFNGFTADQRGVSLPRPSPNQRYDLGSYER